MPSEVRSEREKSPLHPHVTKVVIPVGGLGTRFLPATKAIPKEIFPLIDKPVIQYVVEEAASVGLTDILMVTSRNKRPLEDHFDHNVEIEEALSRKGDETHLDQVRESSDLVTLHYVRQGAPKGLGHALLCAESYVGNEPFAVLLGDDLIDPRDPLLARMIAVQERFGGSVVALMEVDPRDMHLYGCAAVSPTGEADVVRVTGLVEKPGPGEAPSACAVIGRFVLHPGIFDVIRGTGPGRGGEIQLTDALDSLSRTRAAPVHGVLFSGRRYDTGDRADYVRTIVRLACERDDLGPDFRAWLAAFVSHDFHETR
ncbi:UTP--glucose-1-phosphate uridylyltransferase [Streptomyces acidicola]|uniref:UTP--glucose-1-phosphate uridylyltransferase n=1 Tax=Streptomyces acidicola TaxID=2596892 RepID=A0A5N8WR62_9ACTN|nr:UTP--glucose-1-phosphate uridylyltransferase [Streptomyces acidicola]MPY49853.1 UTP--glucose-1-phosphate uridylyltransferase [Streptomyces acidicola]